MDSVRGRKVSEETRRKMSKAQANKHLTEEHKRKIGDAHRGKSRGPLSEEHKRNIGKGNKGKKLTEKARRKISRANTGKRNTKEARQRMSVAAHARWAAGAYSDRDPGPSRVMHNGISMRSAWEARLASVFDRLGWEWEYEPLQLPYELADGPHVYTPDFYVPHLDCYFDPHWAKPDNAERKFAAVREQCGIALVVLNKELLEMYERINLLGGKK